MMDLNTGKPVSRKKYTTTWDDSKHMFTLTEFIVWIIQFRRVRGDPRQRHTAAVTALGAGGTGRTPCSNLCSWWSWRTYWFT